MTRLLMLFAVVVCVLAVYATPVSAQTVQSQNTPALYYGGGLRPGAVVMASIDGRRCDTTTATTSGEWSLAIHTVDACAPTPGAAVTLTVDGVVASADQPLTWQPGWLPRDPSRGVMLTVAATPRLSGSIPAFGAGFGIVVFSGGTVAQLVAATGCPQAAVALFASSGGSFVVYVPDSQIAAVNVAFLGLFPSGTVPAGTAFVGHCLPPR